MNKRTLIIIAIVLGIVALGIGAYFAWKNRAVVQEAIPAIGGETIAPIELRAERLKLMSSREVIGFWVPASGTSSDVLYVAQNGNVIRIDGEGVEEVLNKDIFSNAGTLSVAKSGGIAMLSTVDNGRTAYHVYDMKRNEWASASGDAASLSPDGSLVAAVVKGTLANVRLITQEVRLLQSGDAPTNELLSISPEGLGIQWIRGSELLLTQKPSADYISDMWKVDMKTKKLTKFLSDSGLMVQWSPLGDRALKFTTTEGRNHKLSVINDKGAEIATMRFVTMPDKCVMTTPTQMYCAIPRDQEELAHKVLPDEYLKRNIYFKDGIYQIDIEKGSIRAIFEEETPNIDATNLTVVNDKILFINRYDRKLYSLKLQ